MKAVVIGGAGHIGTYLVPRLVDAGHVVTNVSRGTSRPYAHYDAWASVHMLTLDRAVEEKRGTFAKKIADLDPDIVIDLIAFDPKSTVDLVEALRDTNLSHFLYCSSIWAHGAATIVPATEDLPRRPFGDYGIKKAASEAYLHEQFRNTGFPATVVMPGHITAAGWNCINPVGNLDPLAFQAIGRGEKIILPDRGMETLHHVHADDVAQVFMKAIANRGAALGESFHAVAPQAITLRGLAEAMYRWFGMPENIGYLPWAEWCEHTGDLGSIEKTWDHIAHSDNYSIAKSQDVLGYAPRFSLLQSVEESVASMLDRGVITV